MNVCFYLKIIYLKKSFILERMDLKKMNRSIELSYYQQTK